MFKNRWIRWATVLGFALGGFFDGILLHQILQWHHLLSLVPEVSSLRFQVLWDGYFHALMYVIAAAGLWGLWRARNDEEGVSGLQTLRAVLIGFWRLACGRQRALSLDARHPPDQAGQPRSVDVGPDLVLRLRRPAPPHRRRAGEAEAGIAAGAPGDSDRASAWVDQHRSRGLGVAAPARSTRVHNGSVSAGGGARDGHQGHGRRRRTAGLVRCRDVGRGLQRGAVPEVVPVSAWCGAGQRLGPARRMRRLEPGLDRPNGRKGESGPAPLIPTPAPSSPDAGAPASSTAGACRRPGSTAPAPRASAASPASSPTGPGKSIRCAPAG